MSNQNQSSKKLYVKFSKNWNNKLFQDCFPTIRMENRNYYVKGKIYTIMLLHKESGNYVEVGKAQLVASSSFVLDQLSDSMSFLDANMDRSSMQSMLKNMYRKKVDNILTVRFNLLIFQFTSRVSAK